jgi:hypothetical protein
MDVCVTYTHSLTYILINAYTQKHTHLHTHTYTLTHIRTLTHTHPHTQTHIPLHAHTHLHPHTHLHTAHLHIYLHTHTHTLTHLHPHLHTRGRLFATLAQGQESCSRAVVITDATFLQSWYGKVRGWTHGKLQDQRCVITAPQPSHIEGHYFTVFMYIHTCMLCTCEKRCMMREKNATCTYERVCVCACMCTCVHMCVMCVLYALIV